MNKKILIVDDEPSITTLLEFNLRLAGYEVHSVQDGEAVFRAIQDFRPDLIILDLMLPKKNGLEVCRELRASGNMVPIIMLTALQDTADVVAGLDSGADDYMSKPFSPQELISRIQALFRRLQLLPGGEEEDPIIIGALEIRPSEREARLAGERIDLTPKEYELLHFLCRHKGKALSRRQLLHGVWDYHFVGDTRIVDVHISHLRDKIERDHVPQYIVTVRGVGYKLVEPAGEFHSPGQ